jgi:phytoene dehydrogenase-like protein
METEASRSSSADVIVIGAGLAGLTAATLIARAGWSVSVVDKAGQLGGRAATHIRDGVHWNLGPHALYCAGDAFGLFTELGIPFRGRFPDPGRGLLLNGSDTFPIPAGLGSLISNPLLTIREKWRLARLLTTLGRLNTQRFDEVSLRAWLDQTIGPGNLASLLSAFFRLTTYCDDPERMSAGVALQQLKLALTGNVWYLDGGWQTLVDGLAAQAAAHGAELRTGSKVDTVNSDASGVTVRLADGEELWARAAILAVEPARACSVLEMPADSPLARWVSQAAPIRAACLDLALARLPRPDNRFALGLDRPIYFSVHSAAAKVAPEGVAVVHVMKYLGTDADASSHANEQELEDSLDQVQPGWKEHVMARRYLPGMTVAHGLPVAQESGLRGRPSVAVSERPHVFLAGDWVGPTGMLADASAASAAEAARRVLTILGRTPSIDRSSLHVTG